MPLAVMRDAFGNPVPSSTMSAMDYAPGMDKKNLTARKVQVAVVDGALTFLGLALLCFGVDAVWKENLGLAGTALGGGLILLFAATIHRFESLKGLGMEAKTRELDETIDKAEVALSKLKELTELVGANLLKLSSSIGRFGGAPSIMEAYDLSRQVKRVLDGINADSSAIREALRPWAQVAAIDLFFSVYAPLHALVDQKRLELGRAAAQPSAAGAEAAALTVRLRAMESYLSQGADEIVTCQLSRFSVKLLERFETAPELDQEERERFDAVVRKAVGQLDALADTLDFADLEYWRAVKRA